MYACYSSSRDTIPIKPNTLILYNLWSMFSYNIPFKIILQTNFVCLGLLNIKFMKYCIAYDILESKPAENI